VQTQKITNSVIVNEGGNTTSDVDTALTLTLSLDRERDRKWTENGKRTNAENDSLLASRYLRDATLLSGLLAFATVHLPFSLEEGRGVAAFEAGASLNSFGSGSRRSCARILRTRSRYSRSRAS
jgi:hypothetical protein